MKQSNLLKLSLVASVLAAGAATVVRADGVVDGTYVFTATDGNTVMDGSWITISGSGASQGLSAWDLVDSSITPEFWEPAPALLPPLWSNGVDGNSSVISSTMYSNGTGPDAFSFSIGSPVGVPSTDESAFWFEGQNNLNGFSALYDGFGNNTFVTPATDPIGVWTLESVSPVPDATGTLWLMVAALAAMWAFKPAFDGRATSRCWAESGRQARR
jgi:hypothetical protein